MPYSAKQPCRQIGCPALVTSGTGGYCDAHRQEKPARQYDAERGSSHARGYDRRWRTFRALYLKRHPLCMDCRRAPARDVHHVQKLTERPDLKFTEGNLMGLCSPCHAVRTARGE